MTSPEQQIDDFDRQILQLLQENGRLTNQELSALVGLSPSQCSRRRITLEQNNLILGYYARLSPRALKQEVMALIEVTLTSHSEQSIEHFITLIQTEAAIIDAYKTTGDADYSFKCVVSDLVSLNELINKLLSHRLISQVKTSVILERMKEYGQICQSQ